MFSSIRVSSATCLLSLTLLFAAPFTTQGSASQSDPQDTANQSVSVTPDAETAAERTANTGGHVLTFTVSNTGTETDTYEVICVGVARATCNGTTPTRLTLTEGQSATVDVSYEVLDAGTGLVSLLAVSSQSEVHDHGSYRVPVTQ